MKKNNLASKMRTIVLTVLVMVITFTIVACGNGGGGGVITPEPTSSTYVSWDGSGNRYVLTVWKKGTAKAAYVPANGDTYELVITIGGVEYKSSGTVTSNSDGKIELESEGTSFTIETSGEAITAITAPSDIPTDKGKQKAPASVTTTPAPLVLWDGTKWADLAKNVNIKPVDSHNHTYIFFHSGDDWGKGGDTLINAVGYKTLYIQYVSDPGWQMGGVFGWVGANESSYWTGIDHWDVQPKKDDSKNAWPFELTGIPEPNSPIKTVMTIKYIEVLQIGPVFSVMTDVAKIWLE
jgi:hypothetical protein